MSVAQNLGQVWAGLQFLKEYGTPVFAPLLVPAEGGELRAASEVCMSELMFVLVHVRVRMHACI